jgi:hypothetical protein
LNVHSINEVGQAEMHTAEPLVSETNYFEDETTTDKSEKI